MTFPFPIICPSGGVATATFGSADVDSVDRSTYTWTAALAANATMHLIFADCGSGGTPRTVTALTLGGIAGTFLTRAQHNGTDIEAWIVSGVSGASAALSITWSATRDRGGYSIFGLYGASSTPADSGTATNAAPISVTGIDVPANGVLLAAVAVDQSATPVDTSWSAAVTESYDATLEAGVTHSGAVKNYTAAQTNLTITASFDNSITNSAMIAISFGPA